MYLNRFVIYAQGSDTLKSLPVRTNPCENKCQNTNMQQQQQQHQRQQNMKEKEGKYESKRKKKSTTSQRKMEELLSVVENKVCTEPHQRFIY